ncbi:hypothetical protein GCM10010266_35800 [Streptomyces griseomycini]|nr:hypothetical protein GCM10010266_35800 [Streptomyces griseomycini]
MEQGPVEQGPVEQGPVEQGPVEQRRGPGENRARGHRGDRPRAPYFRVCTPGPVRLPQPVESGEPEASRR